MASHDYSELFKAIDAELADRKAHGRPLRINIWDANHQSPTPRDIATHPDLRAVATHYGKPAYVIEAADIAVELNKGFDRHRRARPADREALANGLRNNYGTSESRERLLEASAAGLKVLYPDPRGEVMREVKFTPAEMAMEDRFRKGIGSQGTECMGEFTERFLNSLSPAEKEVFTSMEQKVLYAATRGDEDSTKIDKKIAQKVKADLPDGGKAGATVPITLYGVNHFSKERDLNEHLPGVDVAIYDNPNASGFAVKTDPDKMRNLPQMVWYADAGRLVKLNNDAAKMEFLGLGSAQQLRQWEKGTLPPTPNMVEALSPEVLAQCRETLKDLKPYQKDAAPDHAPPPVMPGKQQGSAAPSR